MIKNKKKLAEFEKRLIEGENFTYSQKLEIFDALFKEAISLGVISEDNIMEGIEVDIKIAKALEGLSDDRETFKKDSPAD